MAPDDTNGDTARAQEDMDKVTITNELFGTDTTEQNASVPGVNFSPILYAIMTLSWFTLEQYPEATAQTIVKGWFTHGAFSGQEKDSSKSYRSYISKITALIKSNQYLTEVFNTRKHLDEASSEGYYALTARCNTKILESMGISQSAITEQYQKVYILVWQYYDIALHGIFQLTTTGHANVMVQNRMLRESGWYILQLFDSQFKSVTTGTKIEYFQRIVNTQFSNTKSPLHTQTALDELFSSLSGAENTIGLSEQMKVLFVFHAMGSSYEGLKAQILATNEDLSEQTVNGLYSKIRNFFDSALFPKLKDGKGAGNHTHTFVADKHQKTGHQKHKGSYSRSGTRKPLGAKGGVQKKCTNCGRNNHTLSECKVPTCHKCRKAGRPHTHHPDKCWHKNDTTATVNTTTKYTPTVATADLMKAMNTVTALLKNPPKGPKSAAAEDPPARNKFDRNKGDDSSSE